MGATLGVAAAVESDTAPKRIRWEAGGLWLHLVRAIDPDSRLLQPGHGQMVRTRDDSSTGRAGITLLTFVNGPAPDCACCHHSLYSCP